MFWKIKTETPQILEETKLCINCKHFKDFLGNAQCGTCHSPNLKISLVDGKLVPQHVSLCRKYEFECGPEAKWYEAKPST